MSRFLFATTGSLGDLHPYIAIGRALLARSHQAVLATAEEYRTTIESAGLEFAATRPRLADFGDYQKTVSRIFHARRGPERLIRELVMPGLRPAYEDLLRAANGVDLLVSHPLTFALQLMAQRRGLPWVATVLSPLSFMSNFDPPVIAAAPWLRALHRLGPGVYGRLFGLLKRTTWNWEAPLRDFRRELGLPATNQMAMFEGQFSPLLNLALFDPQLAQPQPDWPANTRVCGSPVFDGANHHENALCQLDVFLAEGEAPIVFALGSSAVWVAADFWERAAAAARSLGKRAILITGPSGPAWLPEGVKSFAYLPYSRVFPRAAVVVHQAGIGTLAQALRAGRPQLIVPLAFDQPDNGRRAGDLGVARVIPFAKATTRKLASGLEALLTDPECAARARTIAHQLANSDGAASAAEQLVQCLDSTLSAEASSARVLKQ